MMVLIKTNSKNENPFNSYEIIFSPIPEAGIYEDRWPVMKKVFYLVSSAYIDLWMDGEGLCKLFEEVFDQELNSKDSRFFLRLNCIWREQHRNRWFMHEAVQKYALRECYKEIPFDILYKMHEHYAALCIEKTKEYRENNILDRSERRFLWSGAAYHYLLMMDKHEKAFEIFQKQIIDCYKDDDMSTKKVIMDSLEYLENEVNELLQILGKTPCDVLAALLSEAKKIWGIENEKIK